MVTARLIDNIWATRKADALNGCKLMLAEIIGGTRAGERLVVVDMIGAGIGDRVLVTTASRAAGVTIVCGPVTQTVFPSFFRASMSPAQTRRFMTSLLSIYLSAP